MYSLTNTIRVDILRKERRPGVWHNGGLGSDGVGGRGVD